MNHSRSTLSIVVLLCALLGGCSAAQARQEYVGVTTVFAAAVSGTMSARVDEPSHVAALVQEVNAQRRKSWQSFRGRPGPCAVRLTFLAGDRRIARLILDGDELLELGSSETSGHKRPLGAFDLPAARRLASRVKRQSECRK